MCRTILIFLLLAATSAAAQIQKSNAYELVMYEYLNAPPSQGVNYGNHPIEDLCAPRPIRNKALEMINGYHEGVFNLAQVCDVYDYFKANWTYVSDPFDEEYFASALYSVNAMRGDCDDSAIAIAACVRAIGGQVRLVAAYNYYNGHAYAQVYIGSLSEEAVSKYLRSRYAPYGIYSSPVLEVDPWGNLWLNLDLNYSMPGGQPFPHDKAFIYTLGHPEMRAEFRNIYYGHFPTGQ